MVLLDASCMRYLSKDDFRVLTAIEMGMKNHEVVPIELITSIAKLRHGGTYKFLSTLLRFKLIAHDGSTYNGYRLTYPGYDILALKTLLARGHIVGVGSKIGVGKESDIYLAQTESGEEVVLKFHRLGRTSFRAVKNKRDYLVHRKHGSWLYLSRLAALREYAFMKALHSNDFPTPTPIDHNRHVVLMSKVEGFPMYQVRQGCMATPERVLTTCMGLIVKLAECGLIHCDFNEFNLMIDPEGNVTLIDFPQMISTQHSNAKEYFERDVNCVVKFFAMKMRYVASDDMVPSFEDIRVSHGGLDMAVRASGYEHSKEEDTVFLRALNDHPKGEEEEEDDAEEYDYDDLGEVQEEEEDGGGADKEGDEEEKQVVGSGHVAGIGDGIALPEPPTAPRDPQGEPSWCNDDNPYAEGLGDYGDGDDGSSSSGGGKGGCEAPALSKKPPRRSGGRRGEGRGKGRRRW